MKERKFQQNHHAEFLEIESPPIVLRNYFLYPLLSQYVIRASELDGITHDTEIENYIPELVPGTEEYDQTVKEASRQVEDSEFYNLFSETTQQVREAANDFFDQLHNTLYLLDNGLQSEAVKHLEDTRESYEELEEAYEEFLELSVDTGAEEELEEYVMELGRGLNSVERLLPERPTASANSGEPEKAS